MKLIIRNGKILHGSPVEEFVGDIAIFDGIIQDIGVIKANANDKIIDAAGKLVLPGLVDLHTHFVSRASAGFLMLIASGVTTALDALVGSGKIAQEYIYNQKVGLNGSCMYVLKPGLTIGDNNPSYDELNKVFDQALDEGVFGIKIVGAHYPLTVEANSRAIKLAAQRNIPLMIHAGSVENRDDLNGMKEVIKAAEGNPFILAHVNVYCNGNVKGNEQAEAIEAIELLNLHPEIISESTLSPLSCMGTKMKNNVPESLCMIDILQKLGFQPTYTGLKEAIAQEKVLVSGPIGDVFDFLDKDKGLARCLELNGAVTIGYQAHDKIKNLMIAAAKRKNKQFTVNAFSTDGGIVPRNVTLEEGLKAVELGIFSMAEFVEKASTAGAKILGLNRKGVISPGFDADIIIVDPVTKKSQTVISNGNIVYDNGIYFSTENKVFYRRGNTTFIQWKVKTNYYINIYFEALNESIN